MEVPPLSLTLQEHIDQVTKKVQDKIHEIGLAKATQIMGRNKSYVCRISTGFYTLSTKKLIEYAKALGIE